MKEGDDEDDEAISGNNGNDNSKFYNISPVFF
jgi:hypothetical protein